MFLPGSCMKKLKKIYKKFKFWMNYQPPSALSAEGWSNFNQEFKQIAPIRYWITHTFRRKFIYPIKWKYESVSDWVRYRTVNKLHILKTGLKPGYIDAGNAILHTNFNVLKGYVETSLARRQYWLLNRNEISWAEKYMPFYHTVFPFRRPDLGLKHLEWEITLDDPNLPINEQSPTQAAYARKVLRLYKWWVEERPARQSYEVEYPALKDDDFDIFLVKNQNTEEFKNYRARLNKMYEREESDNIEDDKMLVELIEIRRGIWA